MKEITVITTCELTSIVYLEDETQIRNAQGIGEALKQITEADHVNVLNNQVFVRDLPSQSDTEVVETP